MTTRICIFVIIVSSALLISGCSTNSDNSVVRVQDLSFTLPAGLISVPTATLDATKLPSHIIAAWKNGQTSLILSESSLPHNTTISAYASDTKKRISQETNGYSARSLAKKSFTCNNKKIIGYMHEFGEAPLTSTGATSTYYSQYYFFKDTSVYIFSLANPEKNSILKSLVGSLECSQEE